MHITVMGTKHCYECQQAKKELEEIGQQFTFVDIDENTDEMMQQKLLRASAAGFRNLPIIEIVGPTGLPLFVTKNDLFTLLKAQN